MIQCANCGTENDAGRKFCIQCGHRLAQACRVCSTVNPGGARFCGECGTDLGGAAAAPATSPTADAGSGTGLFGGPIQLVDAVAERRLVSVVFVDLVGFTTASEGRDAEDTRELLTRYYETAREIMGRYGGTIEKFIGDAVMAVWGTPTAHEDDAERAVRAAMELVGAVPRLAPAGQSLEARWMSRSGSANGMSSSTRRAPRSARRRATTWRGCAGRSFRRMAFRGDPVAAEALIDGVLGSAIVSESAQALTWNLAAKAEALIAQARYREALAVAQSAWHRSAEMDLGFHAAVFAAVGMGDAKALATVSEVWRELGVGQLPVLQGFDLMVASLMSLLQAQWDEARAGYLEAETLLESAAAATLLARFRLAFGHLAAGRFPEAVRAAEQAEAYFAERGAQAYVDTYRSSAFTLSEPPTAAEAASSPSRAVRAAG